MQTSLGKRVFGLDLMRAAAISLVVFSHIGWLLPNKSGMLFDFMSISGVLGVEIFFVLSGYLIGRIIYKFFVREDFNFSNISYFWFRRWFRTLPNYFLVLMFNLMVILAMGFSIPEGIWKYVFFIQNFSSEMPPFFYESWSLSIEEFAYIVGPLFIFVLFIWKPRANRSLQFLLTVVFIIVLSTLARILYNMNQEDGTMQQWNMGLRAVVIYRLDAVYYGALAAYISVKWPKWWMKVRFIACLFGFLIFTALNTLPVIKQIFIESNPAFWNVWYLPLNSFAIMLGLPVLGSWYAKPNVPVRLITKLSMISYGVYLLHYSVIMQVMRHQIPNEQLLGFDLCVYILVYLAIVLICAYVLYRFYEKPFTDLRDDPKIIKWFLG